MKKINFILILIVVNFKLFAQSKLNCGFKEQEKTLSSSSVNSTNASLPDSNIIIRIPVIFHVYHHGEAQGYGYNYHEDTLKKALFNLNLAYGAKGGFKESINTKIEFYLLSDSISCQASGIPSNGIKRASMHDLPPYLSQAYFQQGISREVYPYFEKDILQLSQNPTIKCLNIRLIPIITDIQGFVSSGELEDVVLRSNTITDKESSSVFTHELGHVFGLSHTFSDYTNNCNDGDGLIDTDIHQINDIFYPDDINVCTGRRKGKVIYNFMSYGEYQNNFTPMQRDKMRETINFFYPEFVQGSPTAFSSPATKGTPVNACSFSAAQTSTSFVYGIDFGLGSISYKNYYEKSLNYIDYSCALKTELTVGNNYNFYFRDYNTGTIYYKLLIDFNNDGDFNDSGEEILSGQKVATITIQTISGTFTIPANAVQNLWLRMRLIRTNDASYTNCNTNGLGNAMDFSIKVISNCIKPNSPTVSNQVVSFGQSATLTATGCMGQTKWYGKGEALSTGNSFITPALNKDTYYQATCVVNGCESLAKNIKIEVVQTLSIGALSSNNFCVNNTINIPISTSLTNSSILVSFRKGNKIISSKVIQNTNSLLFKIPIQSTNYIGGVYEYLSYGNDYNFQLEAVDIYTNKKLISNVVSLNIGSIENGHQIVDNPNEIYDINKYSYSDYLCTGKIKTYYAQVVSFGGKSLTTDGLTFNWKRNGVSIGTTTTNQITVNQSGTYTFDVSQAGCVGNSKSLSLFTSSYINNSPKIIGPEYSCEGTNKELLSDYTSTTATYQWQKDGTNISNANQSKFNTTQSGNYNVVVQDAGCTIGKTKDVYITFLKALPVNIFSNNNDTTMCFTSAFGFTWGNNIRLEDKFGNGLAILNDYQYQWQKNGVDMPNETKNYLDFSYHDYLNNGLGTYRLVKKQASCTSYSKSITISESIIRPKPVIDYQSTLAVCSGSVSLNAGFLTFGDWYKDNSQVSTSSFYTAYNSGVYKFVVDANGTCQNESDPINVSIGSNFSPKITYSDINKRNLCGTNDYLYLNFDFANSYTGFTYQWLKNGAEITTNGTGSSLYINTAGTYSLRVTNGSCTATSNGIIVGNNSSDIKIKSSDFDLACTNRSAKIEVSGTSNNSSLDNFIWKLNGNVLISEKSGRLYTDKAGTYTLEYNNNAGCSISTNSVILNRGGGSITISPITVAQGQSALLSTTGCSNGIIKWYNSNSSNTIILTGNALTTPALDISRSYFATCFYNNCENLVPTEGKITVSGCLQNQTFTGNNLPNGIFRATNQITSTSIITDGTTYSSGKSINLLPGFKVNSNNNFTAIIGGCTNN